MPPLLVVDLNGVLVHRVPRGQAPPPTAEGWALLTVANTRVYWRRGAHAFLEWALDRFAVAVWTSAREATAAAIVGALGVAGQLAFVWHQGQCDALCKDVRRIRAPYPQATRIAVVDDTPAKILGLDPTDDDARLFVPLGKDAFAPGGVLRAQLEAYLMGDLPPPSTSPNHATADGRLSFDAVVRGRTLRAWAMLAHDALAAANGWASGPPRTNTFGFNNLVASAARLLEAPDTAPDMALEVAAARVHDGWITNYVYWRDHAPYTTRPDAFARPRYPLDDARRNACAAAAYADLPEEEKAKDRVIARVLLDALAAAG